MKKEKQALAVRWEKIYKKQAGNEEVRGAVSSFKVTTFSYGSANMVIFLMHARRYNQNKWRNLRQIFTLTAQHVTRAKRTVATDGAQFRGICWKRCSYWSKEIRGVRSAWPWVQPGTRQKQFSETMSAWYDWVTNRLYSPRALIRMISQQLWIGEGTHRGEGVPSQAHNPSCCISDAGRLTSCHKTRCKTFHWWLSTIDKRSSQIDKLSLCHCSQIKQI